MLDRYNDSELVLLIQKSPPLITTRVEAIRALSYKLVARFANGRDCHDEILALQHAQKLGIRVPTVHRLVILNVEEEDYIIIMERIHGRTLEQLWAEIGWWMTIQLAWQLRTNIRAMHMVTSPSAGGLSSGCIRSPWFQGLYPPASHSSPVAFAGYLNWWLVSCRPNHLKARPDLLLEPLPQHVFIHQDLAPRNMIVDAQNRLWIVDWGYAGFYPSYIEYVAIQPSGMPWLSTSSWSTRLARWRWAILRWIAMGLDGPYTKSRKALAEVHRRSCIYRLESTPYSEAT
jgi:Phosphotransferase enzyme family